MPEEDKPTVEKDASPSTNTNEAEKQDKAPSNVKEKGEQSSMLPIVRDVTRARAQDMKTLFSKYLKRHIPDAEPTASVMPVPPRIVGSYAKLLPILRLIPWFLGAVFIVSTFWDFTGASLRIFGQVISLEGLLGIISVSGMIGFPHELACYYDAV